MQYCHKRIKEIAREIAAEWYESAAHDNVFFKYYPAITGFVAKEWPRFIPHARSVIKQMAVNLGRSDYPQAMKDEILEIYFQDHSLQESPEGFVPQEMTMH
jgi:hypothetical protein